MIDLNENHLKMVKAILQKFIPDTPVWVFGSRILGTAKPYSDLDVVIVSHQQIQQKCYYAIQDALEESELPFRVDVLDWHRISPSFRLLIQQQHVVFLP